MRLLCSYIVYVSCSTIIKITFMAFHSCCYISFRCVVSFVHRRPEGRWWWWCRCGSAWPFQVAIVSHIMVNFGCSVAWRSKWMCNSGHVNAPKYVTNYRMTRNEGYSIHLSFFFLSYIYLLFNWIRWAKPYFIWIKDEDEDGAGTLNFEYSLK